VTGDQASNSDEQEGGSALERRARLAEEGDEDLRSEPNRTLRAVMANVGETFGGELVAKPRSASFGFGDRGAVGPLARDD